MACMPITKGAEKAHRASLKKHVFNVRRSSAMKKAVEAGREAFLAGRMPRKRMANASSPETGYFFK